MEQAVGPEAAPVTDAWARDALARLVTLPGVRRAAVALTEGGGRRLLFTASDRDHGAGVDWCWVDGYHDVPLNTAVRHGRQVVGSLEQLARHYPDFVGRQAGTSTVALAAVPLAAAGQVLGGYVLFYADPPSFDRRQREALHELGARLGAGLRQSQRTRAPRPEGLAPRHLPDGARTAEHAVAGDPRAVGEARRFVRSTLESWGVRDDRVDTAVLCASELVTNAVVHTAGDAHLLLVLDDGVLTTLVSDGGPSEHAGPEERDPLAVHGRGLGLVEALASRWGSDLDSAGMTVWFVLETD